MPEQGKVVKCSCSKCSRSGNGLGYNWVSTETARLHQAHDNRQAWMKERNRKIEAEALGNYVQPRRGPTEPSPFVANQEIDENDVCRLETYLMFMLSSTLLNNALYHRFRYLNLLAATLCHPLRTPFLQTRPLHSPLRLLDLRHLSHC
ncbi:unnamed protein product [Rhizoctonia solani]|nr:unnamed protein product [Rhizoctonia solani]